MIPSVQRTIDNHRDAIVKWLNGEGPPHHRLELIATPEWSVLDSDTETTFIRFSLEKRKWTMPAPWAIREYRYVIPTAVLTLDRETPLVFGESERWFRNEVFQDPEIPPHEDWTWR